MPKLLCLKLTMHLGRGLKRRPKKQLRKQMPPRMRKQFCQAMWVSILNRELMMMWMMILVAAKVEKMAMVMIMTEISLTVIRARMTTKMGLVILRVGKVVTMIETHTSQMGAKMKVPIPDPQMATPGII